MLTKCDRENGGFNFWKQPRGGVEILKKRLDQTNKQGTRYYHGQYEEEIISEMKALNYLYTREISLVPELGLPTRYNPRQALLSVVEHFTYVFLNWNSYDVNFKKEVDGPYRGRGGLAAVLLEMLSEDF